MKETTVAGCDTAQVLAFLTMLVGLLVVLAGIICGAMAYSRTYAEHAKVPLWPALHRARQTIRRLWIRYVLRRPGITVSVSAGGDHRSDQLISQRPDPGLPRQARSHRSVDIPPGGLTFHPRALSHRSQAGSLHPTPQHLTHLDHIDLPEHHRC